MSGGACQCGHSHGARPLFWVVVQRHCNHSAFNGGRWTASAYSQIRCTQCGQFWRTKAAYVNQLNDATHEQATGVIQRA